jgi:hypothetical protein
MRYLSYLFIFVLFLFILTSCDEIEEPYTIPVGGSDTTECPLPEFPHIHDPVKRVLLEDYTGHTCVNCPTAANMAHELQTSLIDRLVIIGVHAGFFAMPLGGNYTADFRTEAGTAWDDFFGISKVGNPNGMVDRVGYNSNHILSPGAWSAKIEEQLDREPEMVVQIINDYDEDQRKLCTHTQVVFAKDTDKNLNLCVVITEDEIIAPQKNNNPDIGPTPDILDYLHMDVLRGSVNTPWGVSIAVKGEIMLVDYKINKSYKYILNEDCDPYKCRVISFVYDADTYEVLQVAQEPVL